MNHKLNEALHKQKIRRIHRHVVIEARQLNEEESLYSVFVEPFADVVQAAKLSGQDILNVAKLYFDVLFTFDPRKMKAATEKYDARHKKIQEKWKPILEKNREALTTGDADLIALVLAPHYFIASEVGMQAWDKAGDIYEYLDETGWRVPLAGLALGRGDLAREERAKEKAAGKGKEKGLMDKIKSLFYLGEGISLSSNDIILEQDEKKPDLETAFQEYLEQTGLDQQIEDASKDIQDVYGDFLSDITGPVLIQLQVISDLTKAADAEQFMSALETASKQEIDLESPGLDQMIAQIDQDAKKLAQTEEFRKKIAGEKDEAKVNEDTESPPQVTDQEALKAAEKIVFVQAKQNFDEKFGQGKEKLKQQVIQAVDERLPNETSVKALMTTAAGREFLEQIDATKQKIKDA